MSKAPIPSPLQESKKLRGKVQIATSPHRGSPSPSTINIKSTISKGDIKLVTSKDAKLANNRDEHLVETQRNIRMGTLKQSPNNYKIQK